MDIRPDGFTLHPYSNEERQKLEQPSTKFDPSHDKKIKDAWLTFLAYSSENTKLLPKEEKEVAKNIHYLFRKINDDMEKGAMISGSFAGLSGLTGLIPGGAGAPIAAILSFVANHKGFIDSTKIGFKYAEVCDRKQDLIHDCEQFVKSLAIRLLDRYIKSQRLNQAYLLQKEQDFPGVLLEEEEKAKMYGDIPQIHRLAKDMIKNLPNLQLPPFFTDQDKASILKPLIEVCEHIQGQRKNFTVEGLRNELVTMRTHYALKLTQRLIKQQTQSKAEALTEQLKQLGEETKNLKEKSAQTKEEIKRKYQKKYKVRYKEKYRSKYKEKYSQKPGEKPLQPNIEEKNQKNSK